MVWHDYKFIHRDATNTVARYDVFLNNMSDFGQLYMRGVEGAAPYNPTKDRNFIFGANGNKICTGGVVVEIRQTIGFF